jgi:putative transposase
MKKSNFTGEQFAFAPRLAEHGNKVVEVCRKMGVSEQIFYRCTKQCSGMGPGELRRLKQLEGDPPSKE